MQASDAEEVLNYHYAKDPSDFIPNESLSFLSAICVPPPAPTPVMIHSPSRLRTILRNRHQPSKPQKHVSFSSPLCQLIDPATVYDYNAEEFDRPGLAGIPTAPEPLENQSTAEFEPLYLFRAGETAAPATPSHSPTRPAEVPAGKVVHQLYFDQGRPVRSVPLPSHSVFKKLYKPVALKARPVFQETPPEFKIERKIIGDPLAALPTLSPSPPDFQPQGRYTAERKAVIDANHAEDFLLPEERKLMHHFMSLQEGGFAWEESEKGTLRTDFFPPVKMPVIPHRPWVEKNRQIPPGLYKQVCDIIQDKIKTGAYEPSNSSYRGRWFWVPKKDGKSLRIVHSLEPLNRVTIAQCGVPPFSEQLAEGFAGRSCGGILDLYVGYDERLLDETSRDYTAFQTPFGVLRLRALPMGWTNSVPIFHEDMTFILRPLIPHICEPYIDDVPVKGPKSTYRLSDGTDERLPSNPGICRFVWEHFQNLNVVVQHMKYAGGTFSGKKAILCSPRFLVIGHLCTPEGRLPDPALLDKVRNWTICRHVSDIRSFLGVVGVGRVYILNFARRAHSLVQLTRKGVPFQWTEDEAAALVDLREALLHSEALRPIDYESGDWVILAVDTSLIAVGYLLAQDDSEPPYRRHYARFGSMYMNEREARFSQPKLELYGLHRAFQDTKVWLIGLRNLAVEMDASYVKQMLNNPDIVPTSSMIRWIAAISLFQFELRHVPAERHRAPDGMSRRSRQPDDPPDPSKEEQTRANEDYEEWVDGMHGFTVTVAEQGPAAFVHLLNHTPIQRPSARFRDPLYLASQSRNLWSEVGYSRARANRSHPDGCFAVEKAASVQEVFLQNSVVPVYAQTTSAPRRSARLKGLAAPPGSDEEEQEDDPRQDPGEPTQEARVTPQRRRPPTVLVDEEEIAAAESALDATIVREPKLRPPLAYGDVPRTPTQQSQDRRLHLLPDVMKAGPTKATLPAEEHTRLVRLSRHFWVSPDERLWHKSLADGHRLVILDGGKRLELMRAAHDDAGHHSFWATQALLGQRVWWPGLQADVLWYTKTCHHCQVRRLRHIRIPPQVDQPSPLFAKVFIDVMLLPRARKFERVVAGRCSLSSYLEATMLRKAETAETLGEFIFQHIITRWGALREIVSDNGGAFVSACEYLAQRYGIRHIRISGYNSRANGIVERGHWDVRQALVKASGNNINLWPVAFYSVLWADRTVPRKRLGVSPYFIITGTDPIFPLDFTEATWLVEPPDAPLSSTDLLAYRAQQLQKRTDQLDRVRSAVYAERVQAARRVEEEHDRSIKDYDFAPGDLVLVRNSAIEKSHNAKAKMRYHGPLVVLSQTRRGAYIVAELDGGVLHHPVAAFRVLPYLARRAVDLGRFTPALSADETRLSEMRAEGRPDPEDRPRRENRRLDELTGASLPA